MRGPIIRSGRALLTDLCIADAKTLESSNTDLRQSLDRRREQVGLLRQRRNDADRAEQEHTAKTRTRDERFEEAEAAAKRREAADRMVEQQGVALLEGWQRHFDGLQQLNVPDVASVVGGVGRLVRRGSGRKSRPPRVAERTAARE